MDINITIEVWQKGKWFIAKCPELDFISQGKTREEAKKNLLEVIQIQFEEMSQIGTPLSLNLCLKTWFQLHYMVCSVDPVKNKSFNYSTIRKSVPFCINVPYDFSSRCLTNEAI